MSDNRPRRRLASDMTSGDLLQRNCHRPLPPQEHLVVAYLTFVPIARSTVARRLVSLSLDGELFHLQASNTPVIHPASSVPEETRPLLVTTKFYGLSAGLLRRSAAISAN
jgi:hypothetical protein